MALDPTMALAGTVDPQVSTAPPEIQIQQINENEIVNTVERFYLAKKQDRQPYEIDWFLNASGLRGHVAARWHPQLNRLDLKQTPSYRRRLKINRLRIKVLAKVAKMVNSRPRPVVVPPSTDREDIFNAKGTELLYNYLWRKLDLEAKYEAALFWAEITGKAFLWVRWNEQSIARFKTPPDQFGQQQVIEAPAGDVGIDLGTAFEVLVDDPGIEFIGRQPRIMRVRAELVKDFEARHPEFAGKLQPDANTADLFQFQRQIADLGTQFNVGLSQFDARGGNKSEDGQEWLLRKEYFEAPNVRYPRGRYALVASRRLVEYREQLPYGFNVFEHNPYPVEEFFAEPSPGQFWPTTMTEQLRPIQEERTEIRSKMLEQLILSMHPRLMAPKQARIPKGAYNSEPNNFIEYHHIPGMPPPFFLEPGRISMDTWRILDMNRQEEDEISNIYPEALGHRGGAESGFQTSLLQEAADAVYGPHKRRHERALASLYMKVGMIASVGYDIERLISFTGRGNIPHVMEFKGSQIDPHAEVVVHIGSALSDQKTTRVKEILELHGAGLFGQAGDPNVNRRVLGMIDLGGMEQELDMLLVDEQEAELENLEVSRGRPLLPPAPWHTGNPMTNDVHVNSHFNVMKSPDFRGWPEPQKIELIRHTILHLRTMNPPLALEMAQLFGQQDLEQMLMPMLMPPPPGPGGPAGPGPEPQAGPPSPGPQVG